MAEEALLRLRSVAHYKPIASCTGCAAASGRWALRTGSGRVSARVSGGCGRMRKRHSAMLRGARCGNEQSDSHVILLDDN